MYLFLYDGKTDDGINKHFCILHNDTISSRLRFPALLALSNTGGIIIYCSAICMLLFNIYSILLF